MSYYLLRRAGVAGTYNSPFVRASNDVDAVIGVLSLLCSGYMVGVYVFNSAKRKLRHKLIFGLSLANLVLAFALTVPTLSNIARDSDYISHSHCQASGVFIVIGYWSTHCHAAFVAIATKWLLMEPLAKKTMRLERYTGYVTTAIFIGAITIACSVLALGYTNNAGFCYIPSTGSVTKQVVYAIIIFGTRCVAFAIIVYEYTKLYIWLNRRAKESQANLDRTMPTMLSQESHSSKAISSRKFRPMSRPEASYHDVEFQLEEEVRDQPDLSLVSQQATAQTTQISSTQSPSSMGKHPESLAAYENRLVASSMLWYPIIYLICFLPSLCNFIYAYVHPHAPSQVLHSLARWFSTAQGIFDFGVYTLIEYRIRVLHRKKVVQIHGSSMSRSPEIHNTTDMKLEEVLASSR